MCIRDRFDEILDKITNFDPVSMITDKVTGTIKMIIVVASILAIVVIVIVCVVIYLGYKNRQRLMDYTYGTGTAVLDAPAARYEHVATNYPQATQAVKDVGGSTASAAFPVPPVNRLPALPPPPPKSPPPTKGWGAK